MKIIVKKAGDAEKKVLILVFLCVIFLLPASAQTSKFTDPRDNKTYRTVVIGNKVWMAENLNHKIGNSLCYDNKDSNCDKYGRLYDWNTAMKACPSGWHLPGDNDWTTLTNVVGSNAGIKLKSQTGWNTGSGYIPGTDNFGFSALPGGYRITDGSFYSVGNGGHWWSAAENDASSARNRYMYYNGGNVYSDWYDKSLVFSVRCLQDERP